MPGSADVLRYAFLEKVPVCLFWISKSRRRLAFGYLPFAFVSSDRYGKNWVPEALFNSYCGIVRLSAFPTVLDYGLYSTSSYSTAVAFQSLALWRW
jgi:hypothetical protein